MILDGLHAAPTPAQRAAANRLRIIAAQRARLAAAQKAAATRRRMIDQQRARLIAANRRAPTAQSVPDQVSPAIAYGPVTAEADWSGADPSDDMQFSTALAPISQSLTDEAAAAQSLTDDAAAESAADAASEATPSPSAGLWLAAAIAAFILLRPFY